MERICFVVQRYGLEVNGGAELLARQLAERMTGLYSVDVATTKAIDYISWKNEYTADREIINRVNVIRFPVLQERKRDEFDAVNNRFLAGILPETEQMDWLIKQGPYCPDLIQYLRSNRENYQAFIFLTYLYYPTAIGIREVYEKAIVLPLAHNEPYFRMRIFTDVFLKPRAFLFETDEERTLVRHRFRNYDIPFKLGGAGVDVPEHVSGKEFHEKYQLGRYVIYVGRIDEGKNCEELFAFFQNYKRKHPSDLKLVLLGKAVIPIPDDPDIVSFGFVSDEDKFNGIKGAEFLVLPSKFESLSIVVLEAFSLKIPVLVNGLCDVLKGHCVKSGGGFWYQSENEFDRYFTTLLDEPDLNRQMGEKGFRYVQNHYQWDIIIRKLDELIQYVAGLKE